MNRGDMLREVADLITNGRNESHGDPVDQLSHAASLKRAIGHRDSPHLSSTEIEAIDMIAVKLSRLAKGKPILDHYLDIAGYAAIAAEARSRLMEGTTTSERQGRAIDKDEGGAGMEKKKQEGYF